MDSRLCSFVALLIAACGTPARAEPQPDASVTLQGSYPSAFATLPGGALAFSAYAEDGNRRAVHTLDGATETRTTILPQGRELSILSDDFVVALDRGFSIYDPKTGQLLKHKQFANFFPLAADSDAQWIDGDVLTVIHSGNSGDATLRRIHLPDLQVIEGIGAPVVGAFTRWGDKIVAIGYWHEPNQPARPSITLLDARFQVLTHVDVARSPLRNNGNCDVSRFAQPLVVADLLIYGSGCGGIRLHDLKTMRQVATREPIGASLLLTFTSVDGRLLALGVDHETATIDEIALPTLQPTHVLRVPGQYFALSGANLHVFNYQRGLRAPREITVDLYRLGGRKPERSLSDSILEARRAAVSTLQKSADVSAAVDAIRPLIPQLSASDVQSLTPAARRALAWYAGLLSQTLAFAKEVPPLFDSIRAASPADAQIRALADASKTWIGTLSPPHDAPTLPFTKSTLTTGVLGGPIAQTDRYVVTGRWCATGGDAQGSATSDTDNEDSAAALSACFDGNVGLAVHDVRDLHFERFIPILISYDTDQENIDGIAILGDVAFGSSIDGIPRISPTICSRSIYGPARCWHARSSR